MMEDTLGRVNRQLARLEQAIEELVGDVDLEELSGAVRLKLASQLLGQYSRLLLIRQRCEADAPANNNNVLLADIMRRMRGEEDKGRGEEG